MICSFTCTEYPIEAGTSHGSAGRFEPFDFRSTTENNHVYDIDSLEDVDDFTDEEQQVGSV